MSAETIGSKIGYKGAKAAASAAPYVKKAGSYSLSAARGVGKAGASALKTVGGAGVSAAGNLASNITGIGQQPQVIIANSAPPVAPANGLGIMFGLLVGYISIQNDNSWSTSIFFAVLTYAIFVLF